MRNRLGEIIIDLGEITLSHAFKSGESTIITSQVNDEVISLLRNIKSGKHYYLNAEITDSDGENVSCRLLPVYLDGYNYFNGIAIITSAGDGTTTSLMFGVSGNDLDFNSL